MSYSCLCMLNKDTKYLKFIIVVSTFCRSTAEYWQIAAEIKVMESETINPVFLTDNCISKTRTELAVYSI